ncbi:NAD-dependent deacetylase sirtuin-2 [Alternaria alternata]|nr:NAD-dependent deacetylase sirtuin-2 [Alternaria alternata]
MSKTASGYGRFRRLRLAYRPVSGDLKSGMPAEVLMPAPVCPMLARGQPSHCVPTHHNNNLLRAPILDVLCQSL